ncbi:hypothetical protein KI387_037559, partial [Taxus chinensis]
YQNGTPRAPGTGTKCTRYSYGLDTCPETAKVQRGRFGCGCRHTQTCLASTWPFLP